MIEKFVSDLPDREPPRKPTLKEVLKKHASGIAKENIRRRIRVPHEGTPTPEDAQELRDRIMGEKSD